MSLNLMIMQRHIDMGKPGDICNCPLALAVTEQFGAIRTEVKGRSVTVHMPDGQTKLYELDQKTINYIADYDRTGIWPSNFNKVMYGHTFVDKPAKQLLDRE